MYTLKSIIKYSEVDKDCNITMNALFNYLQDVATLDGEFSGVGLSYLIPNKLAWLLSYWQVVIDRMPRYNEEIEIKTIPYEMRGPFGHRCFVITGEEGRVLVRANSLWTFTDMAAGKAVRVPENITAAYGYGDKIEMDYQPRKVKLPEGGALHDAFEVGLFLIDTNHHVNNAQYVNIAQNYLPEGFEIGQIRVEYKAQAKLGDKMVPRTVRLDKGLGISLEDEEGSPYALIEFLKK